MNGMLLLDKVPVERPALLQEALSALARVSNKPTILAGGTDLMVSMERGLLVPQGILDISRLDELRKIENLPDRVVVGALATYAEIISHPGMPEVLVTAARTIGATQIQNRGTLGGNIANGSPAGDTLPVLLALDAQIEVASVRGARMIPFKNFYTGYRTTSMADNEMILDIQIPVLPDGTKTWFRKVGARQAQTISKVVFCGRALLTPDKTVSDIRLAVGSVAPTVVHLPKTEAFLRNQPLSEKVIAEANRKARKEVTPIDDVRSTADYRRMVVGNLVGRFLTNLQQGD